MQNSSPSSKVLYEVLLSDGPHDTLSLRMLLSVKELTQLQEDSLNFISATPVEGNSPQPTLK